MITLALLSGAALLTMAEPCSMPPALERRVCADPGLRWLDGELVARERAVQAATARPATWAATEAQFRAIIAGEKDFDGKPLGREALEQRLRDQIGYLDIELATAAGIRAPRDETQALGDACLAGWYDHGCKVPASGILRDGDLRILWQLQSGASEANGAGMGVMLWDASAPGAPRPIGWTFEGVWMHAPRYDAQTHLLWVAGTRGGTGEGNADLLYQKQGDRWVEIELVSWRDELDKRLPKGLGAWHGVAYDFAGMGADTDLWKDKDANCCATGGRATIGFRIEGSSLRLDTLQVQADGPGGAWKDY
jgi:hypothetical protein